MKTKKLIDKYFNSIFKKKTQKQQKLYSRILKKSLKQKKTHIVK